MSLLSQRLFLCDLRGFFYVKFVKHSESLYHCLVQYHQGKESKMRYIKPSSA